VENKSKNPPYLYRTYKREEQGRRRYAVKGKRRVPFLITIALTRGGEKARLLLTPLLVVEKEQERRIR